MSKTLVELCKSIGGSGIPEGNRAYRVKLDGKEHFVFSNSPGQAALSVCEVELVKPKELTAAAFEAIGVSVKSG